MGLVSQSGALQIAVGLSGLPAPFGLGQHSRDVALLHDQVFDPINLDLDARPFTEQHTVGSVDVNRDDLVCLMSDSSRGFLLGLDSLDDNSIVKWAELHGCPCEPLDSAVFVFSG
jgi:hypothetical protein